MRPSARWRLATCLDRSEPSKASTGSDAVAGVARASSSTPTLTLPVIGIPPEHKHNAELDNWLCEHCGEEGDIEKSLLLLFNSLNSEGQRRVLELSYDLMQIRRYQSNYFSAMREAKEANGDAPQDNP